jgi:hypothetical protein
LGAQKRYLSAMFEGSGQLIPVLQMCMSPPSMVYQFAEQDQLAIALGKRLHLRVLVDSFDALLRSSAISPIIEPVEARARQGVSLLA